MKKFMKWVLIGSAGFLAVIVAFAFIIRAVNPEYAAQMDAESAKRRIADSTAKAIEAREAQAQAAKQAEAEAKLLGISVKDLLKGFEDVEGIKITEAPLNTGEPRTMAQYKSFIVEGIGEPKNIRQASIIVINDGAKLNTNNNAAAVIRFFMNTLKTQDIAPFTTAIANKDTTAVIAGQPIKISYNTIGDLATYSVTISK